MLTTRGHVARRALLLLAAACAIAWAAAPSNAASGSTLVAVTVGTDAGSKRVEGTLFGNRAPRLVKIFDIPVEADLTGQMIYIVNTDAPGFIGALGTKLGENGINIATFNLGRRKEKGEAVALVAVDDPITRDVARQLHELPGVLEVVPLGF